MKTAFDLLAEALRPATILKCACDQGSKFGLRPGPREQGEILQDIRDLAALHDLIVFGKEPRHDLR
jgi:hypothetical protein